MLKLTRTWATRERPKSAATGERQQRFERLVRAYGDDLYRFAYWLCRDKVLAEEFVQRTFMRAWRFLDDLREKDAAKFWLTTTLRREHGRRFGHLAFETDDQIDLEDVSANETESITDALMLRQAVTRLPQRYREAIFLQVIYRYTTAEIAEIMSMSPAAVTTTLFRARQELRAVLEGGSGRCRRQ